MEGWIFGCLAAIFMVSMRILAAIYDIGERPIKMLEPVQPPQNPTALPAAQSPQPINASSPAGIATIKESATTAERPQTAATMARTNAGRSNNEIRMAMPQNIHSGTNIPKPPVVRRPELPKTLPHSWPKRDRMMMDWPELPSRQPRMEQPTPKSCDPQDL